MDFLRSAVAWIWRIISLARNLFFKERDHREWAFDKCRDILRERLERASSDSDKSLIEQELRAAEDHQLEYLRRITGILGREVVLDRSGPDVIGLTEPALPEPQRKAIGRAAEAWAAAEDFPSVEGQILQGVAFTVAGELSRAEETFQEVITRAIELDDTLSIAKAQANLAVVWRQQGQLQRASMAAHEAVEQFRKHDDQRRLAASLVNLGSVLEDLGAYEEAKSQMQQAIVIFEAIGDAESVRRAKANLTAMKLDDQSRGDD